MSQQPGDMQAHMKHATWFQMLQSIRQFFYMSHYRHEQV
jgi:hypothetical protein